MSSIFISAKHRQYQYKVTDMSNNRYVMGQAFLLSLLQSFHQHLLTVVSYLVLVYSLSVSSLIVTFFKGYIVGFS